MPLSGEIFFIIWKGLVCMRLRILLFPWMNCFLRWYPPRRFFSFYIFLSLSRFLYSFFLNFSQIIQPILFKFLLFLSFHLSFDWIKYWPTFQWSFINSDLSYPHYFMNSLVILCNWHRWVNKFFPKIVFIGKFWDNFFVFYVNGISFNHNFWKFHHGGFPF